MSDSAKSSDSKTPEPKFDALKAFSAQHRGAVAIALFVPIPILPLVFIANGTLFTVVLVIWLVAVSLTILGPYLELFLAGKSTAKSCPASSSESKDVLLKLRLFDQGFLRIDPAVLADGGKGCLSKQMGITQKRLAETLDGLLKCKEA